MRKLKSILFFGFVLLLCTPSFAKEKHKKDKKATRLTGENKVKMERFFLDAEKAKATEDFEEAIKNYREVITLDPTNSNAHFQLGSILFGTGKNDLALESIQKAVKLDPSNKWFLETLANLYMKMHNSKDAIKTYEQIIKNNPNEPETYFDLAYLYMQINQPENAIKAYDQFEKNYGIEESIVLQKEKIYLKLNKFDNAVAELQKLVNTSPDEVQYLGMIAELYALNGKKDKAQEYFKKILELEPENPQALMATAEINASKGDTVARFEGLKKIFSNPKMSVDTKIKLIYPYIQYYNSQKKKINEAYELANILVKIHPEEAKCWAVRGDLFYIEQKEKEALPNYEKAIELKKDVFPVWQQELLIYSNQRDWKKLQTVCSEALEYFPNQAIIYYFQGNAEYQQKEYDKALKSFSKGEKMAGDNEKLRAQILSNMGDAFHSLNKDSESDSAYEKSLKLDPENAFVLNNYSYYLSLRKANLDRAKQMSAYSNKLEPDNTSFMDTYAWILFQTGDFKAAKEWQAKALGKDDKSATILEHYGDILFMLGEKEDAIKYWKKAKEVGSDSKTLETKISTQKYTE